MKNTYKNEFLFLLVEALVIKRTRINSGLYICINVKETTIIKTVIVDVIAHLKPQKFTVLSDF